MKLAREGAREVRGLEPRSLGRCMCMTGIRPALQRPRVKREPRRVPVATGSRTNIHARADACTERATLVARRGATFTPRAARLPSKQPSLLPTLSSLPTTGSRASGPLPTTTGSTRTP
eukprot:351639-Chlamydomonas_euryale.AAC.6